MPFFDDNPLEKLALEPGIAETELDLRGRPLPAALDEVERLIESSAPRTTLVIRFDPPTNDGRETLFLPLGRKLLEARRNGRLQRCLPLSDGAGFFIETAHAPAD